jgi:uncharacterized protein (UPF0332 family)
MKLLKQVIYFSVFFALGILLIFRSSNEKTWKSFIKIITR